MKVSNVRQNRSMVSMTSPASSSAAQQVDASSPSTYDGAPQLTGFTGASDFEAERKRSRSFEEARRNHVQLNGLMAKVRKPLPQMTQRMARAGLRAGSAGTMRGEYAYRNMFAPVDGKLYEIHVHPVKNLLEWNFTNLDSDHALLPYADAPWGFANKRMLAYGQPWQTPYIQHPADGHAGQSQLPAAGFQYAALQYSPFRQGQFQYPTDSTPAHRLLQRNAVGAGRRRGLRHADPAAADDTPVAQPHAMAERRNAGQWRDVVSALQDAGMTAGDMKEWINDFHDCRRYPCAENHTLFNEKYGSLFDGDIGDESLRPAFDGLRRAFGSALAPSQTASSPVPMAHVVPT